MSEYSPRFWPIIFLEVFESLPRQGPGNRDCAAKALALCSDLPPSPVVLDLGCGVGGQTFHLAELTSGSIVALDSHTPGTCLDRCKCCRANFGSLFLVNLSSCSEYLHFSRRS